ncbi:hypothetical protein TRSC58_04550 [Trypanosoma rangeli SC58]|uniref:Dual specificity phosphatase 12 n=1 Tax=Trypanosoma rangeli SC58 TaxID=429131 RepID=A0A061J384_TRYRA|nr:hypothetical protein TRSC58_04550 [Trypanosoma rangeli SC58]
MELPQQEALQQSTDTNVHDAVVSSTPAPELYVYACRKCRHVLFRQHEIVPHNAEPGSCGHKGFKQRGRGPTSQQQQREAYAAREGEVCTSYFLDPDVSPWVAEESREVHRVSGGADVMPDTIYCLNRSCRAKIGTQSWVGSQCSCGAWVAPAFKIHSRVVDKMPAA